MFLAELALIPFNLKITFTIFSLQSVRTSHTPSLTHCISHTLAIDRFILLAFARYHDHDSTLRATVRTPIQNSLSLIRTSYWGDPPDILAGPTPSTFLTLEGGLMKSYVLSSSFEHLHIFNGIFHSSSPEVIFES